MLDPGSGEVLVDRNSSRKFVPASNQKVLVTAAALSLLGPEYQWETALYTMAEPQGDTLLGDVVLHGSGDPTLGPPFFEGHGQSVQALADSLAATGLRRVEGALVVDVSLFDSTSVPGSWMAGNLPWAYSATGGGFVVDRGELLVRIQPSPTVGEPARVSWSPVGESTFVENRLGTLPPDSSDTLEPSYLPESRKLVLEGGWPAGAPDSLTISARDPVRQGAAALLRALEARGVGGRDGVRVVWESGSRLMGGCPAGSIPLCPGSTRLAGRTSPPLAEVLPAILEPSQNWITEQTLLTLGLEYRGMGSRDEGIDVLETFLTGMVGVDSLDVSPRDGSGLSAYNLVTPRAMVAVLGYMGSSGNGALYRSAMAEPMEPGSTLRSRMDGLQGRLYAKTGTISHVNSLSGYAVTRSGRELLFSILTNGSGLPSSTVRQAIDDLARAITELP